VPSALRTTFHSTLAAPPDAEAYPAQDRTTPIPLQRNALLFY
jgi:hypothetical protein